MSEFKNLPSEWKVMRLEKVAPLQRGYDLPTDNIKEGLYPVVYSNGILRFHNEFKAKAPGVITGRSGTIGKVVYVEEDYWPHNTSLWVTNFYDNNPKFIYYMYINLNLARFSAGSGVPTLNRNDIHAQTIPLPPLDEQKKIAEILSTWDEAINLTINLIENKKRFKKALMQNLLTAKIRFPEFKDEWKETKLKDICVKMRSGGTPKSTNKKFYNGNIPFVKINDMTLGGKYIYDTQVKITEEGLENSSAWLVPKNSLIYSMYASFGFVSINKIEVATSQAMMCIVPNLSKVALEYLYYFLDDFQKDVRSFVETGTQGNLNAEIVKNFKIKLPNLKEQQKIAEVLTACDDEINLLNLKLENLKRQKQGLMQKLLSGKVRVK